MSGIEIKKTAKEGESYWLLNKSKYPVVTDLHIHDVDKKLIITITYNGKKDHLTVDPWTRVSEFEKTLDYAYKKMKQAHG